MFHDKKIANECKITFIFGTFLYFFGTEGVAKI